MCAKLATETREAFSLWGKMVGELHAATEQQKGQTAIERDTSKVAENIAKIDQSFAVNAEAAAKDNVASIKAQLARAEKRLGKSERRLRAFILSDCRCRRFDGQGTRPMGICSARRCDGDCE